MSRRNLFRQLERIFKKKFPYDYDSRIFSEYMRDVANGEIEEQDQLYHLSTEKEVKKILEFIKERWELGLPIHLKLVAECQSGKTGIIGLLLESVFKKLDDDEILFTSGDPSKSLYLQTSRRIGHLALVEPITTLGKKIEKNQVEVSKIKLLIVDEDQIAQGMGSRIHDLMALLYSINPDLIVLRVTATPAGQSHLNTPQIKLESGSGYTGSRQFLDRGQIKDITNCYNQQGNFHGKRNPYFFTDSTGREVIKTHLKEEILRCIDLKGVGVMRYNNPKQAKDLIEAWIKSKGLSISIYTVTSVRAKKDNELQIPEALESAQEYARSTNRPVIIIVQESLKAGFSFYKSIKNKLVFAYETLEANWNSILQGLLGRCSGYHNNQKVHIYTNKEAAELHRDWWEGKIDDRELDSLISEIKTCKNPKRKIQPSTHTKISTSTVLEKNWMTAFPLKPNFEHQLKKLEKEGKLEGFSSLDLIELVTWFLEDNEEKFGKEGVRVSRSKSSSGSCYMNTKAWGNYEYESDRDSFLNEVNSIIETGEINREKFVTSKTRQIKVNVGLMVYDDISKFGDKNPQLYLCLLNGKIDKEYTQSELEENNFHSEIPEIREMLLNFN